MGEEEKKVEENKVEEKKVEEKPNKVEEGEKKEEAKEEKKGKSNAEAKVEQTPKEPPPPPPPPPQEIVLRVYMHCEGCARKVRKSLKGFQGVEDVMTDCKTHKVVVKGEKADPLKVLARVQRKSHRHVELLSPIPPPPPAQPKKPDEKQAPKPPEKKEEEPQVITVLLKVHMHCEACAHEIKKRIQRMKGVEIADTDLKGSQVTVKGVFDPAKLVEYVYKKTGKHAVVIKQEPEKKKEEIKGNDPEKKGDEGGDKEGKKTKKPAPAVPSEAGKEKKEAGKEKKEEGGEKEGAKPEEVPVPATGEKEPKNEVMEMIKKNEFYYYFPPQNYQIHPPSPRGVTEVYPPAPQMFSDENPNACSVM